jgi:hypothetical protein
LSNWIYEGGPKPEKVTTKNGKAAQDATAAKGEPLRPDKSRA